VIREPLQLNLDHEFDVAASEFDRRGFRIAAYHAESAEL
jgi:hypothetical protein